MSDDGKSEAELRDELKRLRERVANLEQIAERFHLAMETTDDALWDWNMVTNEVYRSPRHAIMLGYEPGELSVSQEEWEKRIHPDDRAHLLSALKEHLAGTTNSIEVEYRLQAKSGDYVWILGRSKVVAYGDDGTPKRMIGTNIDITRRKRAEKELRDSRDLLDKMFRSLDSAVFILNSEKPPRIIECNPAACNIFGYAKDQMIGLTTDFLHVDKERWLEFRDALFAAVKQQGHLSSFEYRMRRADGDVFPTEHAVVPLQNDDGDHVGWISVIRDITERRKSLEAIREKQSLIQGILDHANSVIVVRDVRGKYLMVNREAESVLGMDSRQIIGKTPYDIHAHDKAERILSDDRTAIEGLKPFQVEDQLEVKGQVRTFLGARFPLLNPANEPYAVCTVMADITDRKKAENALRQSERGYRTLVEQLPAVVYTAALDETSTTLYVSPQIEELIGFSPEEYKADPDIWRKRLHPDDRDRVLKAVVQGHAEKNGFSQEYRMIGKDARVIWFRDDGVVVKDEDGQPLFLQGVMYDVTEQKKVEEEIRKFKTIADKGGHGVGMINPQGDLTYVNVAFAQMHGYTPEELIGRHVSVLHAPEQMERVNQLNRQLVEQDNYNAEEVWHRRKDNTVFPTLMTGTVIRNEHEEPMFLACTAIDITKRREMENALRESEEKYRTLVESAGETIATVDAQGIFTFMNTTAAKRLGGEPKDFTGKSMWELFPKQTADRQAASVQKVITTGQSMNVIVPTDVQGQVRWYNTTIEPLKDSSGKAAAALIIARDIHELRQAGEQIRTLSSAIEQSMDGIAMGNAKSQLSYVNEAYARIHGYSPQEIIGKNIADMYAMDQRGRYKEIFAQIQKDGLYTGQAWHVRKDGTEFPCYISVTLLKNERAEAVGTVAVCRDMTEARQKQEELSRYRSQMARAEQLASLGTLSATVAHQITQPLTVIRLSLENALDELEGTSCPDKTVRRLQDSIVQVSNMTDIVNRFRNFARQSSDTGFGQVNVNVVAERVVRLLEETARQARVTLQLKGMGKLPSVGMKETDLEQLFFALLENAIQAADRAKTRRIIISGALKKDGVELRFSDNCGGIAPEIRDKIFEPFFTTKPRGHGTGLGLCIVHDAVVRVGGRIRLESKLGRGTTFFVTLPVTGDGT